MPNVNPIQVQKARRDELPGLEVRLVEHARQNDADIAQLLEREIPDRAYVGPSGVTKELAGSLSGN
jgi:hypothetical protein